MLDNDELTYSYQKRPSIAGNSRQSDRALITVDRSQKLDLFIHLLTNLQQSLIVCGPEGIGKTTLLKTFEASHQDSWPICILQGSADVSFESAVAHLSRFLNLSNTSVNFDLSPLRTFCDKQKVVLIIDDAGKLMPGLIGELIDFADTLTGLRLVLALSNDELQDKAGSDSAIDECHFIELPPLNQRQCLEYLQNLSAQPGSPLSFNAITDALVEDMYRQTHGVPGKLLNELPKFKHYQNRHGRQLGLWLGIISVLAVAGFAVKTLLPASVFEEVVAEKPSAPDQAASALPVAKPLPEVAQTVAINNSMIPASELLSEPLLSQDLTLKPEIPVASPEALLPEPKPAQPIPDNAPTPQVESVETIHLTQPSEPAPVLTEVQTLENQPADIEPIASKPVETKPAEKSVPVAAKKIETTKAVKAESDGGDVDWIMAQPASNYTVQVMVLSSQASVTRFLRKYADYRDDLKYYVIGKEGKEKFVIIYGSFPSSVEALNNKSDMPGEFNSGLVKRFNQVQRASRR